MSIEKYYNNIVILKNEDEIDELGFKDRKVCEDFIHNISNLWPRWIEDEDKQRKYDELKINS